ncbi:MAG: AraC family transcriptional regulator [Bradyrhizobium sp.]
MKPIKLVTPISGDPDAPTQNLVGLGALAAELAAEGISVRDLFARTGVDAAQLEDARARISHRQRLAIYRNAKRLAKRSDIALLAGARQRISDYGIYGYALVSSRRLEIRCCSRSIMSPWRGLRFARSVSGSRERPPSCAAMALDTLGDLLPFAAEFWRSSMTAIFSRVLESPFPSKRMVFPFPAPPHWRNYERMFNCPIDFGADRMEWHFDANVLDMPCPNANPITAQIASRSAMSC